MNIDGEPVAIYDATGKDAILQQVTDGQAVGSAKQAVREKVWTLLEQEYAVPAGVHGRIPNFAGAEHAADRLAALDAWRQAQVVKSNPDKPQFAVRLHALRDGKLLYMAVPKLATRDPFYLLDPTTLGVEYEIAATSDGAAANATAIGIADMRPVDLIVCGSVAVNPAGVRVGKGAGYADIEVALLTEAGLIGPGTTIVTTVHELQILDEDLPETAHDFSVDLIVTPERVIRCGPSRRPTGIVERHLTSHQLADIPILASRRSSEP